MTENPSPQAPVVSVVITAHNEADFIVACLKSLAIAGMEGSPPWEVILVDDRSQDGTGELALGAGLPQLRLVRIDSYKDGPLSARQVALDRGIREARGEIILLTDADASVPAGWGRRMSAPLLAGEADAVSGDLAYRRGGWMAAFLSLDALVYFFYSRLLKLLGRAPGGVFGNFAFRRDLYMRLGGFETLGFSLIEDHSFVQQAHRKGYRIKMLPGLPVLVKPCPSMSLFIDRAMRVSRSTWSALAVSIWMLFLMLPVFLALALAGIWGYIPFFARYTFGLCILSIPLFRRRAWKLLPLLFFYEVLCICFGLWAAMKRLVGRKIRWGGVTYDRW